MNSLIQTERNPCLAIIKAEQELCGDPLVESLLQRIINRIEHEPADDASESGRAVAKADVEYGTDSPQRHAPGPEAG